MTHNTHDSRLNDEQHLKARVEWHKRYIQDLVQMKKEEQKQAENNQDTEFSTGRRRWFNQEIQNSRNFLESHGVKVNL